MEFAEEVTETPEGSGGNSTETDSDSNSGSETDSGANSDSDSQSPPSSDRRKKREATSTEPPVKIETKEDRIKKRIEELKVTFTGTNDCVPPEEGKYLIIKVFGKFVLIFEKVLKLKFKINVKKQYFDFIDI